MKQRLFLPVVVLLGSQFCWAVTINNQTQSSGEVIFIGDNHVESPAFTVKASEEISYLEPSEYFSVVVKFVDPEELIIRFDNIHNTAALNITLPVKDPQNGWAWLASRVVYYSGIVASGTWGAVFGMAEGAKLGSVIGIHIAQKIASSYTPLVQILFKPFLLSAGNTMGVSGGCAAGAVGGAIALPLAFAAGWWGISTFIGLIVRADNTLTAQQPLEEDWVLVEAMPQAVIDEKPEKLDDSLAQ